MSLDLVLTESFTVARRVAPLERQNELADVQSLKFDAPFSLIRLMRSGGEDSYLRPLKPRQLALLRSATDEGLKQQTVREALKELAVHLVTYRPQYIIYFKGVTVDPAYVSLIQEALEKPTEPQQEMINKHALMDYHQTGENEYSFFFGKEIPKDRDLLDQILNALLPPRFNDVLKFISYAQLIKKGLATPDLSADKIPELIRDLYRSFLSDANFHQTLKRVLQKRADENLDFLIKRFIDCLLAP